MFALLEESNTKDAIVMIGRMESSLQQVTIKWSTLWRNMHEKNKMITEFSL